MASMEFFDDLGLVVAQLVAAIDTAFLGPHHEGHPELAIEVP